MRCYLNFLVCANGEKPWRLSPTDPVNPSEVDGKIAWYKQNFDVLVSWVDYYDKNDKLVNQHVECYVNVLGMKIN